MTTPAYERPADFDVFWHGVLAELAQLPVAPEVEEISLRSSDIATVYGVRLTSIGPYRIFGYLSVPKGQGPFPARYFLPRYGSVTDLVPQGTANGQRHHFVTFSICVRGQRRADSPYAASFPGQLTDGIDDPSTYVYRGIVADCCRGLEYLAQRPEVDTGRIATIGTDLALATAALCPRVTHLISTPVIHHRALERAGVTQAYPLEELNDYLRQHPDRRDQVANTLNYYDLAGFAPTVEATSLLVADSGSNGVRADYLEAVAQSINGPAELRESEHSNYRDGAFAEVWLSERMGLEPSLPPHWQGWAP